MYVQHNSLIINPLTFSLCPFSDKDRNISYDQSVTYVAGDYSKIDSMERPRQ